MTGAIKDKILPEDDVVHYALLFLQKYYPKRLFERYKIESDMEYVAMLDTIGKHRGAYLKGMEIDYSRVYQIVLTDIRNKQLGGLSFDRSEDVSV
jgi:ribosome biogenesis GTPase A